MNGIATKWSVYRVIKHVSLYMAAYLEDGLAILYLFLDFIDHDFLILSAIVISSSIFPLR